LSKFTKYSGSAIRGSKPRVVDLFSGAGLFGYAFQKEGFRLTQAVEWNLHAAETYRRNLGDHIEVEDVRKVRPRAGCDVIIAGPPCQGFSSIGKRHPDDERNFLGLSVVKWAAELNPRVIVIENVALFTKSPVWETLRRGFVRLGYEVDMVILNAADFGAPQKRARSFTFAYRGKRPDVNLAGSMPPSTVRRAWEGLPRRPDGKNFHSAPVPSALALARMRALPPESDRSWILRHAPKLARPSWHNFSNKICDVWGRLKWDVPANTIRTAFQNPSKGRHIHPVENRVMTLREGARLQTIPDRWTFAGLPTHIAMQIGNSVPPALGRAVARAVIKAL